MGKQLKTKNRNSSMLTYDLANNKTQDVTHICNFWGLPPKACKQVYHYAIILHNLRSNAVAISELQITTIWLRKITKGRCGQKSTMEKGNALY
jgi:hypothetical protein